MSDFFRGWRPKTGIIALLLSLLMMTDCLKSFALVDGVGFGASSPVSAGTVLGIRCGYFLIPLTVLSAYLLCIKPRLKAPVKPPALNPASQTSSPNRVEHEHRTITQGESAPPAELVA